MVNSYAPDVHITQRFSEWVRATPEALAVKIGGSTLTYQQLDNLAVVLAEQLKFQANPKPGDIIGIFVDRSLEYIIGILAILKVGCVFMPIDSGLPSQRIRNIIRMANPVTILTIEPLEIVLATLDIQIPSIVISKKSLGLGMSAPTSMSYLEVAPSELAYCIFTSGTSGTPKGVLVKHQGVVNLISDWLSRVQAVPNRRCAWWTTIGFDVSIFEIFSALLTGACLYPVPERVRHNASRYAGWLQLNAIDSAYLPPTFLIEPELTAPGLHLSSALVGVEPIEEKKLFEMSKNNSNLLIINGYGPTETTVFSSVYTDIRNIDRITPIGKPISNTTILILDDNLQQVPEGTVGDIYIGGMGVAAGYLNDPALTRQRFIRNPITGQSGTLYKTGDCGKYLSCGNIAFSGRKDSQIKISGVRIELEEIEHVLCSFSDVLTAVVGIDESAGESSLTAYVVLSVDQFDLDNLRVQLMRILPSVMIPTKIVPIHHLPMTLNGKTDRQALFCAPSGNSAPLEALSD